MTGEPALFAVDWRPGMLIGRRYDLFGGGSDVLWELGLDFRVRPPLTGVSVHVTGPDWLLQLEDPRFPGLINGHGERVVEEPPRRADERVGSLSLTDGGLVVASLVTRAVDGERGRALTWRPREHPEGWSRLDLDHRYVGHVLDVKGRLVVSASIDTGAPSEHSILTIDPRTAHLVGNVVVPQNAGFPGPVIRHGADHLLLLNRGDLFHDSWYFAPLDPTQPTLPTPRPFAARRGFMPITSTSPAWSQRIVTNRGRILTPRVGSPRHSYRRQGRVLRGRLRGHLTSRVAVDDGGDYFAWVLSYYDHDYLEAGRISDTPQPIADGKRWLAINIA